MKLATLAAIALTFPALAAEPPVQQPPTDAPQNSVGALIYRLCGEPIAILYVVMEKEGPQILTISGPEAPKEQFEIDMAQLTSIERAGGPVHTVELNKHCTRT